MSETVSRPRASGPDSGHDGRWNVIVLNDNHNTFEGVASALARVIPGVSFDRGLAFAQRIHTGGLAIVWSGHRELAEHYWDALRAEGLTMAPLEQS